MATDALHAQRQALLSDTLAAVAPQVLITELFPFGRRILRAEFGAGAAAAEAESLVRELGECFAVGCVALTLVENRSVPLEAVSLELAEDCVCGPGGLARRIKILHAQ